MFFSPCRGSFRSNKGCRYDTTSCFHGMSSDDRLSLGDDRLYRLQLLDLEPEQAEEHDAAASHLVQPLTNSADSPAPVQDRRTRTGVSPPPLGGRERAGFSRSHLFYVVRGPVPRSCFSFFCFTPLPPGEGRVREVFFSVPLAACPPVFFFGCFFSCSPAHLLTCSAAHMRRRVRVTC